MAPHPRLLSMSVVLCLQLKDYLSSYLRQRKKQKKVGSKRKKDEKKEEDGEFGLDIQSSLHN